MDLTAARGTGRDYRISEYATPTPSADHIAAAVCFGSHARTQCEKVPVTG
ncbi:hypothetical protein SAMN05443247_04301 [Bradyrhizobium erythrophlei]|nr:hypothetical protein SAMN05443247_04301 [Bradyrhizobium erythrophlei]